MAAGGTQSVISMSRCCTEGLSTAGRGLGTISLWRLDTRLSTHELETHRPSLLHIAAGSESSSGDSERPFLRSSFCKGLYYSFVEKHLSTLE